MAKPKQSKIDPLEMVVKDYQSAINYLQSTYWDDWDDYWRLYNGEDVDDLVGYQGTSQAWDPMTFSTIETILANIYGSKPRFSFLATMEDQEKDTKILNSLMDYYWECNNMSSTIIPFGREVLIVGNAVLFVGWNKDRPEIKHIPIRDTFFDPTARSLEDARYCGYRRLTSLSGLKKETMYDAESDSMVPKYKNLDQVRTFTDGVDEQTDKELKDAYHGSTVGGEAKKDQVEVLYYITKDKVIEVANRSQVIYEEDNPFQRESRTATVVKTDEDTGQQTKVKVDIPAVESFMPVVLQRNYIDGSLLYGKGEVEPIAATQAYLNDTIRQKSDNVSLNLDEVKTIDPAYADLIPQIQSGAGVIIPIPKDAIGVLPKMDMSRSADGEIARAKQSIREATGSDEVVRGVKQDSANTTATEINAQLNQAGQRFAMKIQGLENEGYKQLADILFKFTQIFVTADQVVRIVGDKGIEWAKLNPDMYWGSYEPVVELESNIKAQDQKKQQDAIQMLTVLRGDPMVNQKELYSRSFQAAFNIDEDEAQLLIANQDPSMDPSMMGGQPGMPGQQPQGAPPPPTSTTPTGQVHESADLVKLYQATSDQQLQAQIVQALGFQPSDPATTPPDPNVADKQVTAALKIQQAQHLQEMDQAKHGHQVTMDHASIIQQAQQQALAEQQAQAQQQQQLMGAGNGNIQ